MEAQGLWGFDEGVRLRERLAIARLTFSIPKVDIPTFTMFMAALTSLLCFRLQPEQCHPRSLRESHISNCPQCEQVLDVGSNLSI